MKEISYEQLLKEMIYGSRNMLILGEGGSGKSRLVREFAKERPDALLASPTGIAAINISGRTLNSLFGIRQYCQTDSYARINDSDGNAIRKADILLTDEISMVKFNLMDLVDERLKEIRKNQKPFGGMRLIFMGDLMQLEPVMEDLEEYFVRKKYPDYNGDKGFYRARVLRENDFFDKEFDCYNLRHNFRQEEDPDLQSILREIRKGRISAPNLEKINSRYAGNGHIVYDISYHYLTKTWNKAGSINQYFVEKLPGKEFKSEPVLCGYESGYYRNNRCPIGRPLAIKAGMKVMFVMNDTGPYRRWANGTMGIVKGIRGGGGGGGPGAKGVFFKTGGGNKTPRGR
jgi:hypothetical protein